MKNKILGIVSIAVVFCISFSCNEGKNLQELLQEERKAIDRYIVMNDLVVLKEYPKGRNFKDNEYFRTDDGLFLQVVDSGNGKRVKSLDEVSVRFDYLQYVKEAVQGIETVTPPPNPYDPYTFVYGIPQTYSAVYPMSQAWVIPLLYVGEEAVLNIIVPSTIGSSYDYSNVLPVVYKNFRYTSFN